MSVIIVVPKRKMLPLQEETVQPESIDVGSFITPSTLDNIMDGYNFGRVKIGYLTAGQIVLDSVLEGTYGLVRSTVISAGEILLDETVDGTYSKVLATAITAGRIKLSSAGVDESQGYGLVLTADISAGHIILSSVEQSADYRTVSDAEKGTWDGKMEGDADLDDIPDGETYQRILSTHISAGKIKLLDVTVVDGTFTLDKIGDGATYGRILVTDISAGSIKLSSVAQTSDYRTVSDGEKGTWNDKPEDMDEIGEGVTYQRVRATDISAGHIKLSSITEVEGEWYNESGVEIDAAHGINIYGVANALTTRATKTGTIQCYVGADGKFYAGAGKIRLDATDLRIMADGEVVKVIIDSDGIHSWGDAAHIYNGGAKVGGITGDTWGPSFYAVSGKKARIAGDTVEIEVPTLKLFEFSPTSFAPPDDITQNLGTLSKKWKELFVKDITVSGSCVPVGNMEQDLGADGNWWRNMWAESLYLDSYLYVESILTAPGGDVDLHFSDWMDLPRRSSYPSAYDGRIFLHTVPDIVYCYSDHEWVPIIHW